jgi:hypothetical protein
MKYISIFILVFIILVSIYLGTFKYFKKYSEGYINNIIDCPDGWESGINENGKETHFCIFPKLKSDFNPTSINGCCLWLDANDYNKDNATWKDKSSNKFEFRSYAMGSPPTLTQLSNGKNFINFKSNNKNAFTLYKPQGFQVANKSLSLFVVCRFNSNKKGAVFSKWERSGTVTRPSGVFIGNEYDKLYSTIIDTEGNSNPPEEQITNKWLIMSLMGNIDSTGKFYINGVKQKGEFNKSSKNNIFNNENSIVIGGSADNTGYTMRNEPKCEYKKATRPVTKKIAVNKEGKIEIQTTNATYSTNGDYDIYTFEKNGSIQLIFNWPPKTNKGISVSSPTLTAESIFAVDALSVGGGGGGGFSRGAMEGSGGGGGGMVCLYNNLGFQLNTKYDINIGSGGGSGQNGGHTEFKGGAFEMYAYGGGRGGNGRGGFDSDGVGGDKIGSGGGGQGWGRLHFGGNASGMCNTNSGGIGNWVAGGGGGGGAKTPGESTVKGQSNGGKGGQGFEGWFTGGVYGAGGYGGEPYNSKGKPAGSNGGNNRQNGEGGKNPGDGGGGGGAYSSEGGSGKNGIFIVAIKKCKLMYKYIEIVETIGEETYDVLDCSLPPTQLPSELDPNMFLDGDIAEIIAYSNDSDISDENRVKIESNLAIKWDLIRLPEFANNKLISEKLKIMNVGKEKTGYIGYDANVNNFVNANGTVFAENPVWNNEPVNKNSENSIESNYYQIDFRSPSWNTGDYLENACSWAKNNNIYWDKISKDCKDTKGIDLLSH